MVESLDGVDLDQLDTANLDVMAECLRKLECEKVGLLDDIRLLRVRLSDEKEDQSDVYYYLHKKLDDNYDVISALERQLMVETADREKAETEYDRQIDELEHRRDEELAPLKEKLITVEEQVNSMHEAAENKRESDAHRARLEKELESTKSIVEGDLNVERRKKLQEKQRVRRQVEAQIKELSTELFSQKEVELADKTVRAADNNGKLHAALQAKAKQAERMMVTNQGLAFENGSLRNDVDLAKASEVDLGKRVRLYHDLVIGLKAQLEQEVSIDKQEEQELADLQESLAGGRGNGGGEGGVAGSDTALLALDAAQGAEVVWAGGACGGLVYESVDELRVAVESLQRLHVELKEEARNTTAQAEEAKAANARRRASEDPLVTSLLEAAEKWMTLPKPSAMAEQEEAAAATALNKEGSGGLAASDSAAARGGLTGNSRTAKSRNRNRRKSKTGRSARRNTGETSGDRDLPKQKRRSGAQGGRPEGRDESQGASTTVHESGVLAAATATPHQRRELFYALVDAFRDHQARARQTGACSTTADTNNGVKNTAGDGDFPQAGGAAEGAGGIAASCLAGSGSGGGVDELIRPIVTSRGSGGLPTAAARDKFRSGGGNVGGEASASDLSSVSVRTLCDFGAPERRVASTQTIAKHFPEKFASVRPPRKLMVNTTFLTSNSVFSASTVRSGGFGTELSVSSPLSTSSQLIDRRR